MLPRSSPADASGQKETVIGVADMKVLSGPGAVLTTYALGSCLGVVVYDAHRRVGGMLHAMLPDSKLHRGTPVNNRSMFLDTGLADLLTAMARNGSVAHTLECKVFGGSQVMNADQFFRIGNRNVEAFRALSQKMGLQVKVWEIGGQVNRTIKLHLETGHVLVRTPGKPLFWL